MQSEATGPFPILPHPLVQDPQFKSTFFLFFLEGVLLGPEMHPGRDGRCRWGRLCMAYLCVHRVFPLSREGEDYKVCRFSNTHCAKLRLVLQGCADGGEMPTVLLCTWQQHRVPAWHLAGPEDHRPGYRVALRPPTLQCYKTWPRLWTTLKLPSYVGDTWV